MTDEKQPEKPEEQKQPASESQPKPSEETKPVTPAPAAKPAVSSAAQKTSPPQQPGVSRRKFISWFAIGWIGFSAAMAGFLTSVLRFFFPNVLFEPPMTFKAGIPSEFQIGQVDERFKNKFGVWMVRSPEGIYALSTVCTHLGCTPTWLPGEEKFKCPCHGSGFYKTGINFEGPAPRPLERYRISLADDGQVLVDKGKIYQQEKGEWKDPQSILKV